MFSLNMYFLVLSYFKELVELVVEFNKEEEKLKYSSLCLEEVKLKEKIRRIKKELKVEKRIKKVKELEVELKELEVELVVVKEEKRMSRSIFKTIEKEEKEVKQFIRSIRSSRRSKTKKEVLKVKDLFFNILCLNLNNLNLISFKELEKILEVLKEEVEVLELKSLDIKRFNLNYLWYKNNYNMVLDKYKVFFRFNYKLNCIVYGVILNDNIKVFLITNSSNKLNLMKNYNTSIKGKKELVELFKKEYPYNSNKKYYYIRMKNKNNLKSIRKNRKILLKKYNYLSKKEEEVVKQLEKTTFKFIDISKKDKSFLEVLEELEEELEELKANKEELLEELEELKAKKEKVEEEVELVKSLNLSNSSFITSLNDLKEVVEELEEKEEELEELEEKEEELEEKIRSRRHILKEDIKNNLFYSNINY